MSDKYEVHKKFYDISDGCSRVVKEMNRLANVYEAGIDLSNSLQTALGMVFRYEGKTQREIAMIYQSDYQNMIRYMSQLEKRGFIKKVQIDPRRKGVYLTEEGQRINEGLMEERGIFIDQALSTISEEELFVTKNTLNQLIKLMEERHTDYIEENK